MSQVETPLRGRRRQPVVAAPSPLRGRLLRYILVFVTVVLVVDALVGDKGLLETMRVRRQYAELSSSLESVREQNQQLRETIRRLNEDPGTIEAVAREELGLVRPGEIVFVVHDVNRASR
jgi:cell division protein FtsB